MTLVLELAPELDARLQVLAAQQGAPLEAVAAQVLVDGVLSEEERDALEDAHDLEEIRARPYEGPPVLWAGEGRERG
jgi:plasmid stability protein